MELYITKKRAIEVGLTHEGYLFGVPAWFADNGHGETTFATPKCPPLTIWCWLIDKCYEAASYFIDKDYELRSPIRVTGPINKE